MFDFLEIKKMFDFLEMNGTWEERSVARYENGEITVDTCAVTDSTKPFETGIQHPSYNDGEWIIVEEYDTKEQAERGHKKWVKILTSDELPRVIEDKSTSNILLFSQEICPCKLVYERGENGHG